MTNPDNAVGTNGAFGGRTSVNAFNDVLSSYASRGVISGWGIVPSSGMTLSIGGNGTDRDVAIAADATNNKTTVNNISGVPIQVTLDSAPAANSRYDAIVVYVDKPPISNATQDNPECCGIIPVSGMTASTPAYPDDDTIRSAITADGASGATAYYAILGYVLVAADTTAITSAMITTMQAPALNASVDGSNLTPNSVTSDKIDSATFIVASMGRGYVTTTTDIEKLPIDTVLASKGGAFTISNNEIVVGAGVRYVRISGNVTTFGGSLDKDVTRAGVRLVRGSSNVTSAYLRAYGGYNTLSLPANIVSVQKGDRFWLWFRDEQRSGVTIATNISNIVIEAIF